jgi:F-type H+-transporting ATPase subunit b
VTNPFLAACELKCKVTTALFLIALLAIPALASASARSYSGELRRDLALAAYGRDGGQEHPPTPPSSASAGQGHEAPGEHAAPHSVTDMILAMGWPVANFIIFVGVLYYVFNKPFRDYLASRSTTIRKDLVEAAELKAAATAQLATIEQQLQALPGELEALRRRGTSEIAAEEQRIAAAATADRDRLLEQTRREIDLQVRLAKREILEHAADLSLQLATERIKKEVTPADQDRLVDRYLDQVKKA